jgi:hypothetical protein
MGDSFADRRNRTHRSNDGDGSARVLGNAKWTDAQPCARPDGTARGFNSSSIGAAHRLA